MNPYTLPEGNVQIAFSGGRTSGFMLHNILEANGPLPDRVRVLFSNTGREMPQTLDFVQEVGERWGVPIVWLEFDPDKRWRVVTRKTAAENGEPFEALIRMRGYLPNARARFCSQELKTRACKRYVQALGWHGWHTAIGIRADEDHRARRKPASEPWTPWFPMVNAGHNKHDVAAFWRRQPFDLRLPNRGGVTPLGNCDVCFLKSEDKRARMARDYPERYAWWQRMEALAKELGARPAGARFLRAGQYGDLRKFTQRQGDWIFNTEDALCQRDGGECTDI